MAEQRESLSDPRHIKRMTDGRCVSAISLGCMSECCSSNPGGRALIIIST